MSIKSLFFTKWGWNLIRDSHEKNNNLELALDMFNRAIKADPHDLKAYAAKCGALMRMQRHGEAVTVLNDAIQANPEETKSVKDKGEVSKLEFLMGVEEGYAASFIERS